MFFTVVVFTLIISKFSLIESYFHSGNRTDDYLNYTTGNSHENVVDMLKLGKTNFTRIVNLTQDIDENSSVDCFGLGSTVSNSLAWFIFTNNLSEELEIRFFLTSRRDNPRRVEVMVGDQFGLEWTDFKIERPTIIIVHGFLSSSNETWIVHMSNAFLLWDDVNIVVVDWSARGNTWNYYKAAENARIVGKHISKFLSHIVNATVNSKSAATNWSSIHLIGHSLGAHICGIAARKFKMYNTPWKIRRITGLDPAQPCFAQSHLSLNRLSAPFVDVIHTNGKLMSRLGLGLPEAIGHMDFYPNGGQAQPGCVSTRGFVQNYFGLPKKFVDEAICSHGRSYVYFTESIIAAKMGNGSFWGHSWNGSLRQALKLMDESCVEKYCVEMGIKAMNYRDRGTFFVMTSTTKPFCELKDNDVQQLKEKLRNDFMDETE